MDSQKSLIPVHVSLQTVRLGGEPVWQVVKAPEITAFDANTYAKAAASSFHNGAIRVKVRSRLLPDAPDFARGFIGLAFRIQADDSAFESFYIRPTNGRTEEPVRKNRALQYFSYPTYTFDYFRTAGIQDYEGPADIGLDEWVDLKVLVKDQQADLYVNDMARPVLQVSDLKMSPDARGAVGLFVDTGTEGYFKDLVIEPAD